MPRSALLVSSEQADHRFSLYPLARALVPVCGHVDHLLLDAGHRADVTSARALTVDRVRCRRVPVPRHRERLPFGTWLSVAALERWAALASVTVDKAAQGADLVIVQSGLAAGLIARLKRHAPDAQLAYLATESLKASHPSVGPILARRRPLIDHVVAIRPTLQRELASFLDPVLCFTPPDIAAFATAGESPYPEGLHVIVVGKPPLDGMTVEIAASAYPDVTFVLLGDVHARVPANVRRLEHVAPPAASPFLIHADAALVASVGPDESQDGIILSGQLALLGSLGLPTVCPNGAAGHHSRRYGYDPGRSASLREALALALGVRPKRLAVAAPDWSDLAALLVARPAPDLRSAGDFRIGSAGYAR